MKSTMSTGTQGRNTLQLRLAIVMSMTVLEFIIFQLPATLLILTVMFQTITGQISIPHEFSTVAFAFLWFDSIINPLWTSFISRGFAKNNKVSSNTKTMASKSTIQSFNLKKLKSVRSRF